MIAIKELNIPISPKTPPLDSQAGNLPDIKMLRFSFLEKNENSWSHNPFSSAYLFRFNETILWERSMEKGPVFSLDKDYVGAYLPPPLEEKLHNTVLLPPSSIAVTFIINHKDTKLKKNEVQHLIYDIVEYIINTYHKKDTEPVVTRQNNDLYVNGYKICGDEWTMTDKYQEHTAVITFSYKDYKQLFIDQGYTKPISGITDETGITMDEFIPRFKEIFESIING